MKQSWMTRLGIAGLIPLATGCGSAVRPEESVAGVRTPPPYSVVSAPQATARPGAQPAMGMYSVYTPSPAASMPAMDTVYAPRTQTVPAVVPNPPTMRPIVLPPRPTVVRPAAVNPSSVSTSMRIPTPETPVAVSTSMKVAIPEPPQTVTRGYRHTEDYSTLVGELHFNARHNTWRLRFAGVDVEDRYGGSVTLDGVGRMMNGFKTGQTVRVQGALIDSESREISPAYRVRDIFPMD